MKFSIDVLYLDGRHRVLKAVRNVRPWRLSACLRAHSVLELAAGAIDESGTEIGDVLVIQCSSHCRAEAECNRYLQRTTVYGG